MDNKTFAKYLDLPALNGEHFGSASKRAGRLAGKHAGGHTDRLANVATLYFVPNTSHMIGTDVSQRLC